MPDMIDSLEPRLPRIIGAPNPDAWALAFGAIAVEAGAAVMGIYGHDAGIGSKTDGSPVTEADIAAERIILRRLRELAPGIPVVAEEEAAAGRMPGAARRFILVDPLDGTREFLKRNGEFTVNIALIEDGSPVAGAVYAPALETLWIGGVTAGKVSITPGLPLAASKESETIRVRSAPLRLIAVASRSHADPETEALLDRLPLEDRIVAGSSLKFCRVAEGQADLYPRFSPTMEWDTAAGHAVLAAAGGTVVTPRGDPFLYDKVEFGRRNGPFVAVGDPSLLALLF
jgi:3'(2'), 5'-bisphosphate nucleotidase